MSRKLCSAIITLIAILCFISISGASATDNSCSITASVQGIKLKLDQTEVVEFELIGTVPQGSLVTAKKGNSICDLSWGENRRSARGGVIMSLNITGVQRGETTITVCLKDQEDVSATINVEVFSEPGMINFMGMSWDITPDEFDKILTEKGLNYTRSSNYSISDSWFRFDGIPFEPPYSYDLDVESKSYSYKSSQNTEYRSYPLLKVAGYNVKYLKAEFKTSYSIERKRQCEPYRLARAAYEIWQSDIPKEMTVYEAYDDLTAKLSKLYGEPTGSEKGNYYTIKTTWWHAADGTGVSLEMHESIGVYDISIEYGVADEAAYLNNIYAIDQWKKQQVVDSLSENVDGL